MFHAFPGSLKSTQSCKQPHRKCVELTFVPVPANRNNVVEISSNNARCCQDRVPTLVLPVGGVTLDHHRNTKVARRQPLIGDPLVKPGGGWRRHFLCCLVVFNTRGRSLPQALSQARVFPALPTHSFLHSGTSEPAGGRKVPLAG